jgi:dTMP kinase
VISDRYVDSSLAYQGAGRTLPVQEISWLSSWATGGLKPDLVVLLDVDPGVGLGRVDARGLGTDRLESESRAFHERVRYAFLDLAAGDPKRYLVLDAARPAEEIGEVVIGRVKSLFTAGDSHPAPASTSVPPGPDLDAPDLANPDLAGSSAGRGVDRVTNTETPLEEMAELMGVDDGGPAGGETSAAPGPPPASVTPPASVVPPADGPAGAAAGDREVGRRRR